MNNRREAKKGVTVVEVVIVATLSCVILGVGMAMMRRSNTQFKKSNDLISIQRLMDNIIERIRTDVRSLKRIVPSDSASSDKGGSNSSGKSNIIEKIDPNTVSFIVVKHIPEGEGKDIDDDHRFAKITYLYNPDEKTLYRFEVIGCNEYGEEGEPDSTPSSFHGARQVVSMNFEPVFTTDYDDSGAKTDNPKNGDDFKCLNVAMQIASNEYNSKDSNASTLSIACQFYSTCVESELRIANLRKKK
ncbi:MAG: hypothetical protein IKP71_04555 [Candidatus Riflebacteria bacterium]|nr:hypothetical protein [Candidatus Riflebacteria bacterium]